MTFSNPYSRALLWLLLAHPPLHFLPGLRSQSSQWPNPLFHRWGNCNPDWGSGPASNLTWSQRQSQDSEPTFGVLSTHSPWAVSFLGLLESVSMALIWFLLPLLKPLPPSLHRLQIHKGAGSIVC